MLKQKLAKNEMEIDAQRPGHKWPMFSICMLVGFLYVSKQVSTSFFRVKLHVYADINGSHAGLCLSIPESSCQLRSLTQGAQKQALD